MKAIKLLLLTAVLAATISSCCHCVPPSSTAYATKAECEAREVTCPSCPAGRQCIQLSNGTWHAE